MHEPCLQNKTENGVGKGNEKGAGEGETWIREGTIAQGRIEGAMWRERDGIG